MYTPNAKHFAVGETYIVISHSIVCVEVMDTNRKLGQVTTNSQGVRNRESSLPRDKKDCGQCGHDIIPTARDIVERAEVSG